MTYSLNEVPTRVLMKVFRGESRFNGYAVYDGCTNKAVFVHSRPSGQDANGFQTFDAVSATFDEIKAELGTREHVPSKSEGKLIRRLKAQTGMTEAELRAHPKFGMQIADHQFPNRRVISKAEAAKIKAAGRMGSGFGKYFKVV